jgi:hypothetical protein
MTDTNGTMKNLFWKKILAILLNWLAPEGYQDKLGLHFGKLPIILLFCAVAFASLAQSVILGWNPSISTNVVDYHIHYGTNSGSYNFTFDAGNATNCLVSNLVVGVHYYMAATALNAAGSESPFSNEIVWPDISGSPGGSPWFW